MTLDFYCGDEYVPMHFYEAMQIFAHLYGMPGLHPGAEGAEFLRAAQNAGTDTGASGALTLSGDGGNGVFLLDEKTAREDAYRDDPVLAAHHELADGKNLLKRYLYKTLTGIYGYESPWGALTGVRPTKVFHNLLKAGLSEEEAREHFMRFFGTSEKKTSLCAETFANQRRFLGAKEGECGLYVSIPFCPTICSYCTFGSSPVARYSKRIDEYVDRLVEELEFTAELMNGKLKPSSVYIGGGTPTSISAEQLARVMNKITELFGGDLEEFSVEAGRPDTVTEEKLAAAMECGATRVSINPQTMNAETLKTVGRAHTPEQTEEAFTLARKAGFTNINMDLIAGLPGETAGDFSRTLEMVCAMRPDGITVHTLALKRASRLAKDDIMKSRVRALETEKMCDAGFDAAHSIGLSPFYMYRQKNCVGNNENVSYCRPGAESPYNIHIMEEDMTVIACGAGAVTKIVKDGGRFIKRFFNTKSVDEYYTAAETVKERKTEAIRECELN
ncbi:MAG: coproporphyrinogen dehydrogenase HemZ [Clostridia bacterium]|nr:coproporphyrinogen dehydrogenase HemZ [Clostridia bacterium]